MRLATVVAVAAVVALGTSIAIPASAQLSGGVPFSGLMHHPLGAAALDAGSSSGGLEVLNIGSSGQDGVSVELAAGSTGCAVHFRDRAGNTSDPPILEIALRGAPTGSNPTLARVHVESATEGEDVSVEFPGAPTPFVTVVLLDAGGAVLGKKPWRPCCDGPLRFRCPTCPPAALGGRPNADPLNVGPPMHVQTAPKFEWIKETLAGRVERRLEIHYSSPVSLFLPGSTTPNSCSGVVIVCDGTLVWDPPVFFDITCSRPSTAGSGSISLAFEKITFACASCVGNPSGAGDGTALGLARFYVFTGTTGGTARLTNLGSSGQDGVSVTGEDGCCHTSELSVAVSDITPVSPTEPASVDLALYGTVGGVQNQLAARVVGYCLMGVCNSIPDFTPIGGIGFRARLYRNGVLLADATNPSEGPSSSIANKWYSVELDWTCSIVNHVPRVRMRCITDPCPGWGVRLNGVDYVADQIVFDPVASSTNVAGLTPVDNVASMEITSSTASAFSIPSVSVVSSAPLVGVDERRADVELATARISPNPATGSMRVLFSLPQAGRARVSVLDVSGREVRGLGEGSFGAGAHELRWDGRDEAGRPAAAGVYFVRVEAGSSTRVARVTRLW